MRKIRFLACLCIMILLNIVVFPIISEVYAEDVDEVILNFINNDDIINGEIHYDNNSINLSNKINNNINKFDDININNNNMKINLSEKDYYLKINNVNKNTKLKINGEIYDIPDDGYFKLDNKIFSENLDIEVINIFGDISVSGEYDGFGMEIYLNDEKVGGESKNVIGTGKGYIAGNINNQITIQLAFGDGTIGSVEINGEFMTLPEEKTDKLTFLVKPAKKYEIKVMRSLIFFDTPRTIIWDSEKSNNSSLKDDELLKNGTIEILDIKDKKGNSIGLNEVKQNEKSGWATVKPGYKVIMKLKPDYGYQLTSIKINDQVLKACGEQSTFEYIMPNVNVHLSGIFERVEDVVKCDSDKVKSGNIEIGENEIDSGSVILSVSDVELTPEQILNFKKEAKDYKISSYLNINLEQVLYKGISSDVWKNELNDLNNDATISFQLESGLDGNDVIMVHEKGDGSYEILPTTYDSKTNTITFKTSSFSNYAIASREVFNNEESNEKLNEETNEALTDNSINQKNPKTGDNIMVYAVVFIVALIGVITIVVVRKNKDKKESVSK